MSQDLRSSNKYKVFLIGTVNHQITGTKLPSNRQVLAVLFYNIRQVKLTVQESANLTMRECLIFWEKARIPTKILRNCVEKLVKLHGVWQNLQKNSKKMSQVLKNKEQYFVNSLDNLFDIAHADALQNMKIEEDKIFLQRQREPGRPGSFVGVDQKLSQREERKRQRILNEEKRQLRGIETIASPNLSFLAESLSSDSDDNDQDQTQFLEDNFMPNEKRARKTILTPKLVAALDRCQLSIRDSVYVLQAALEALGFDIDDFIINKSSINRVRNQMRKERAVLIKTDFQNNIPDVVTIHWDGKLLPALNANSSKEERLPILISFSNEEKLIAVPKIDHSTGKEQAAAIVSAIIDWQLLDKVEIMCCDTTASNTCRFNGACALLEQALEKELLFFGCRHHIYELVLKAVFESKLPQVTVSADIPLFKKFKNNWKNINHNLPSTTSIAIQHFQQSDITKLINYYFLELQKPIVRGDYRELIELSIVFLNGDHEKKLMIRPPGAMHQARWMARAIYALKMYLLRDQLNLTAEEKAGLQDISLFIATTYVKPWMNCNLAVKAPHLDLCFLKALKEYENVEKSLSEAGLNKMFQHLYYLSEEVVILSLFDDDVDVDTKNNIVANLTKERKHGNDKRYKPAKEEINSSFFSKKLYDFVTIKSKGLFHRLKLNDEFLTENAST